MFGKASSSPRRATIISNAAPDRLGMVAQTLNYFYVLPGFAGGALAGAIGVKMFLSTEEALSTVTKLGSTPLYISGATLGGLTGAVFMAMRR